MEWKKIHDELFKQMNELYSKGSGAVSVINEHHAQDNIIIDCCRKHNLCVTPLDKYGAGILLQHVINKNGGIMSFIVHPTPSSTRVEFVVFEGKFSKKFYNHVMQLKHYKIINGLLYVVN